MSSGTLFHMTWNRIPINELQHGQPQITIRKHKKLIIKGLKTHRQGCILRILPICVENAFTWQMLCKRQPY